MLGNARHEKEINSSLGVLARTFGKSAPTRSIRPRQLHRIELSHRDHQAARSTPWFFAAAAAFGRKEE